MDDILNKELKNNEDFIALESDQRLKKYETFFSTSSQNIREIIEIMKFVSKKEEELLLLASKDDLNKDKINNIKIEPKNITVISPNSQTQNRNIIIQKRNINIIIANLPNLKLNTHTDTKNNLLIEQKSLSELNTNKNINTIDNDSQFENNNDSIDMDVSVCEHAIAGALPESKIKM